MGLVNITPILISNCDDCTKTVTDSSSGSHSLGYKHAFVSQSLFFLFFFFQFLGWVRVGGSEVVREIEI